MFCVICVESDRSKGENNCFWGNGKMRLSFIRKSAFYIERMT